MRSLYTAGIPHNIGMVASPRLMPSAYARVPVGSPRSNSGILAKIPEPTQTPFPVDARALASEIAHAMKAIESA